ncbi:hypothetical protein SLEP1_g52108 [Rubroshorea leprosula]|uniref:BUB1 N-terminal domain-containing protein n=1 Tax=Rubroshorea leprosula TaxID=152421 RepID=A0AAV5M7V9_9ROSI|nr:hypothetical protein SLEP1_g52108 [Rubroshorea leprosula]
MRGGSCRQEQVFKLAVILQESDDSTTTCDPLLPWLWSIKRALDKWYSGDHSSADLDKLLSDCITAFKHSAQYRNDIRFLKICASKELKTEN